MEVFTVRRQRVPIGGTGLPDSSGRSPTVLLVTGDASLRAAVSRVLEDDGYQVLEAAHSGHALLAAVEHRQHIDVLAADLSMDEMSGPALAERLLRDHPSLQALYFGHAATPDCENVLLRPFTGGDLLKRLEQLVTQADSIPGPTNRGILKRVSGMGRFKLNLLDRHLSRGLTVHELACLERNHPSFHIAIIAELGFDRRLRGPLRNFRTHLGFQASLRVEEIVLRRAGLACDLQVIDILAVELFKAHGDR